MSEAFIPPAAATPAQEVTVEGFGTGTIPELEEHLRFLRDQLEGTKRELESFMKRDLERQPLIDAIEYIVEREVQSATFLRRLRRDLHEAQAGPPTPTPRDAGSSRGDG